jgi:hypothetical protein
MPFALKENTKKKIKCIPQLKKKTFTKVIKTAATCSIYPNSKTGSRKTTV